MKRHYGDLAAVVDECIRSCMPVLGGPQKISYLLTLHSLVDLVNSTVKDGSLTFRTQRREGSLTLSSYHPFQ